MKTNKWLIFAIVVPVGIATIALTARARPTNQQPNDTIPAPANWIPFDADYESIDSTGATNLSGRYFQSSDGSWRQDGWSADGTPMTQIANIATKQGYTFVAAKQTWVVQPLDMDGPGRRLPGLIRSSLPGLSKLDKLYEGRQAYEYRDARGTVMIQIPDLNWFTVVTKWPEGRIITHKNIQVREQEGSLFSLPADAAVEYSARPLPMGKIRRSQNEPSAVKH